MELHEVLIRDIHAAALMDDTSGEGSAPPSSKADLLPPGVYLASATVRLDRSTVGDSTDPELRPPAYPAPVKYPAEREPYIPETTVWIENPAIVNNQGDKIWEHRKFAEQMANEREKVRSKGFETEDRFYLTGAKFVEVPDKSYLEEDSKGRMRPTKDLYEDHGEMSIAHFEKRPTIGAKDVLEKLREEGALSGQVRQPLRLTRHDQVYAKEYNNAGTTRRYFSGSQADNDPSVEGVDVRPHIFKHEGEITEKDRDRSDVVVNKLQTSLDRLENHFPHLAASDLLLPVTFYAKVSTEERVEIQDVSIRGAATA